MAERRMLAMAGGELEVWLGDASEPRAFSVCAAHPAEAFGADALALLSATAQARAICVNPLGLGGSSPRAALAAGALEQMVDEIEAARSALGLGRWVFWGMSGGGWLGQLYAHRHPHALAGLILESVCACFHARVADPQCLLSPYHPAWRERLGEAGLIPASAAASDTTELEWVDVAEVGSVLRARAGGALLVSPMPLSPEMRRTMPALLAFDARSWLPRISLPVLVLCGTADPIVPLAHARALHDAIAGSQFVAIDGAGHVPTAERRPQVTTVVRRFLAGLG